MRSGRAYIRHAMAPSKPDLLAASFTGCKGLHVGRCGVIQVIGGAIVIWALCWCKGAHAFMHNDVMTCLRSNMHTPASIHACMQALAPAQTHTIPLRTPACPGVPRRLGDPPRGCPAAGHRGSRPVQCPCYWPCLVPDCDDDQFELPQIGSPLPVLVIVLTFS